MPGVAMPGGWTLSMAWLRTGGQSWLDAGASFLGMWVLMMGAMMLPGIGPDAGPLPRCRRRSRSATTGLLTALVGVGYFAIWASIGAAIYLAGAALAAVEMRLPNLAHAVPLAVGMVVLAAGMSQVSPWKARQLVRCRKDARCADTWRPCAGAALRHGLRVGVRCAVSCAGPWQSRWRWVSWTSV